MIVIRLSGIGVIDFPEIQGCKVGSYQWFDREESAKVAVNAPRGERAIFPVLQRPEDQGNIDSACGCR